MDSKYKVVIVDDMTIGISYLKQSLKAYETIQITGTATNVETAEKLIFADHPDLLFLDVELDNQNGFEFYNGLKDRIDWRMYVIIYSNYDKYLKNALRYSFLDFLKKPFDKIELNAVMNHFFNKMTNKEDGIQKKLPESDFHPSPFMVQTITGSELFHENQIVYFEYENSDNHEQWSVVLTNQTNMILKRNTTAETIVNYSPSFVQINQRQIINISYLSRIDDKKCILHKMVNTGDKEFIITRTFQKLLHQKVKHL